MRQQRGDDASRSISPPSAALLERREEEPLAPQQIHFLSKKKRSVGFSTRKRSHSATLFTERCSESDRVMMWDNGEDLELPQKRQDVPQTRQDIRDLTRDVLASKRSGYLSSVGFVCSNETRRRRRRRKTYSEGGGGAHQNDRKEG